MPSEPQKKHEIHIDGNVTNSSIIIGDENAVSSSTAGGNLSTEHSTAAQTSGRVNMPLLRLTQKIEKEDTYRIEMAFEDDGSRQTAEALFDFKVTPEDRADLRWYMEDYLQYPLDPAPEIARRIEKRMKELGGELFKLIFKNEKASRLWAKIEDKLDDTRVEIVTDVKGAVALPWELLRDPETDAEIALRASAFVRAHHSASRKAEQPQPADKVRILLVICRPGGGDDVPFRSVSGHLLKGLTDAAREHFELDVLRPPTFEQLSKTLRNAKTAGKPYHVVHFDGHGGYLNTDTDKPAAWLRSLIPLMLSGPRDGSHGYLFFEHPKPDGDNENTQLVDGPALGRLLAETDTPVLILNACRSAHAEFQEKPDVQKEVDETHSQVRAFGSLAQEVMNEGVAGVVAMRYNVYVVTAAQFVADLYAALASGQGLGEAVSMGRKQLAAQPLREIAFDPIALQDWSVPVAYEAAPIQLFQKISGTGTVPLRIDVSKKVGAVDNLPRPDVGFFGRDETILALDRAFDSQSVVLLHAYAGSGKTMTAAEFARWYAGTGGLRGPILFTSFEQYRPLAQVLSAVEETYRPLLEANNIQWLALSDDDRLNVAMQIFQQIPPLWIWDNIEPIHGFPSGADSAWSEAEQRELRSFLQIVTGQTKTKFLLTSRRDERDWLGDIPKRVSLPPMPMQERVQLTRALADKHGRKLTAVKDWLPLLRFTQGNPLTITVIAGQALRDGITTPEQIQAYLNKLHTGEKAFEDEAGEGRSKSLGASLSYGFEHGFSDEERKVLALLYFFQGFVFEGTLRMMGGEEYDWSILEPRQFDSKKMTALLDSASEIGLLIPHGDGRYTIHPALPWFFHSLFEQYYSPLQNFGEGAGMRALRAFVEAMGKTGDYCHDQYGFGEINLVSLLQLHLSNLLYARSVARQYDWWNALTSIMQGLNMFYYHTGGRLEWKRLVEEIIPDFFDENGVPLPDRGDEWLIVTDYVVFLAIEERNWEKAKEFEQRRLEWNTYHHNDLLTRAVETLSSEEKNSLRSLGISLGFMGEIQRELGEADCVEYYQRAIAILELIGDNAVVSKYSFNIGLSYINLPSIRDLNTAEKWFSRSLDSSPTDDNRGQSKTLSALGSVSHERFNEAREKNASKEELIGYLNTAGDYHHQALATCPSTAITELSEIHTNIAHIYFELDAFDIALKHVNQSIYFCEIGNDLYNAGNARFNVASILKSAHRYSHALLYAKSALRNFEIYQGRAKDMEDQTKYLIGEIEKLMKERP
ncbi:MAG: CHAT domain-containing protein [Anaerolineaceae bacterium]|nr:MAG: CHAT domain-containing protein [Anaerolineaceae bacterium]